MWKIRKQFHQWQFFPLTFKESFIYINFLQCSMKKVSNKKITLGGCFKTNEIKSNTANQADLVKLEDTRYFKI